MLPGFGSKLVQHCTLGSSVFQEENQPGSLDTAWVLRPQRAFPGLRGCGPPTVHLRRLRWRTAQLTWNQLNLNPRPWINSEPGTRSPDVSRALCVPRGVGRARARPRPAHGAVGLAGSGSGNPGRPLGFIRSKTPQPAARLLEQLLKIF